MRAVVTGATGAVGMAMLQALSAEKIETLVLCRPGSERNARLADIPYVSLCECGLDSMAGYQPTQGYDVFFHFAWEGTTGASRDDTYLQNRNVRYTLDAVSLAKRFGCHTFIGAGSQAEYGPSGVLLRPDTPTNPTMGYGMAKLCAGQMSRMLAHQLGMKHIWARILSVYGPYDTERSMVMSTVRKLLRGEKPSFTPCEQTWDYLYSADAAQAFLAMARKGRDGAVYCLGGGEPKPLSHYILAIRDAVDPTAEVGIGELAYPPHQVMYLGADIRSLCEDTGYMPRYRFEEGIMETVVYAKAHPTV
ncbi:MAG: NAD(P)-dependent oxidoreductase [Ruminococcaceae bacterium]|nr:NAD(P)-dependent oxidoreductase [Oscillospiraceae bacterium]